MTDRYRYIKFGIVWTLVSVAIGLLGGRGAAYLDAPFYFGFFLGFTLASLTAMFVLAAKIAGERTKS